MCLGDRLLRWALFVVSAAFSCGFVWSVVSRWSMLMASGGKFLCTLEWRLWYLCGEVCSGVVGF